MEEKLVQSPNVTAKEFYRNNVPVDLPLFNQPFWLDIVSGDNWDVVIVIEDDKLVASLVYSYEKRKDKTEIFLPIYTPFTGPYLAKKENLTKNYFKVSNEIETLDKLIDQLPEFKSFRQKWNYKFQNWMPLYWKHFTQTTHYWFIIEKTEDLDLVKKNFRGDLGTEIRNGEKKLKITRNRSNKEFYELVRKTYAKQNETAPASYEFYDKLINELKSHNAGEVLFAELDGQPIATLLYAWDSECVYSLISGLDSNARYNGAASFLMWTAISEASLHKKPFNFCGSMMQPIEKFLRKFGGTPYPYFVITKVNQTKKDLFLSGLRNIKQALFAK